MFGLWLGLKAVALACKNPKPGQSLSHGFWREIWTKFGFGPTESQVGPSANWWLGFGFGTKAKKPWLFGLRPKPEHH
jgi:hypothetical protein